MLMTNTPTNRSSNTPSSTRNGTASKQQAEDEDAVFQDEVADHLRDRLDRVVSRMKPVKTVEKAAGTIRVWVAPFSSGRPQGDGDGGAYGAEDHAAVPGR